MKTRKRLTREESKDVTRMRLVEAAERLFIRKGFDEASVEDISETAGYSRGAFYSNFENKEQVGSEPAERIAAVREWFSNQWRLKDFIALRMEFTRRAMRDRFVRKHLSELRRQELETYAASVDRYLATTDGMAVDRPEIVALVLLAVAHGLGSLAIDTEPEWECLYTEAAKLVFDRMTAPKVFH